MNRTYWGLFVLLSVACGGDDKDTATDTGTTQVDPSTTGGTETPGTGETTSAESATTAASEPTTGEATTNDATTAEPPATTGETTDGETTAGETTDGETTAGGDEYDQSCTAVCTTIQTCFPDEFYLSQEECEMACSFGANEDPACRAAGAAANDCIAAQACDPVLEGLINEEYGDCQDEVDAQLAACGG